MAVRTITTKLAVDGEAEFKQKITACNSQLALLKSSLAATENDALTAFGLKASDSGHFAGVLAKASSSANTNVGMMGETFKYAAPVAGALGYSIEDVALAVGLMANAGIKGSTAGTALRTTLTNLSKPSKDIAAYMDALGVSLTDNRGKMRSLSDLMDILRERFENLTEAEKAEYAAGIAGKEAMSGLLAIVNASEADYLNLADAISKSNNAAYEMSQIKLDNYAGQITLLNSAVDGFKVAVGESLAPALGSLAAIGTGAFSWATEFVEQNPWLVQAIAGAVGAVGLLASGLTAYTAAAAAAKVVQESLNLSMSLCPIVAVTAAAGALLAVVVSASAKMAEVSEGAKKLTKSLEESKAAYDELTAAMEEERSNTFSSVKALNELLETENKSAAQKEALARMVDQLNEAVPELCLAYDAAADSINMTGDALECMALSGCQRGIEGTARSWMAGELIGRNFTAKDHNDLIAAASETREAATAAKNAAEAAQDAAEEAEGKEGPPGKTAYEYAVDGGYTGTEDEFQALMGSGPWLAAKDNVVISDVRFGSASQSVEILLGSVHIRASTIRAK